MGVRFLSPAHRIASWSGGTGRRAGFKPQCPIGRVSSTLTFSKGEKGELNMKKLAVLIAIGANNIEVPCRIFPDIETAKTRCDEILGTEGDKRNYGYGYGVGLENEEDPWPISKELFTRFYYGCGGPYAFVLKEVDFDTKFVGFDLD